MLILQKNLTNNCIFLQGNTEKDQIRQSYKHQKWKHIVLPFHSTLTIMARAAVYCAAVPCTTILLVSWGSTIRAVVAACFWTAAARMAAPRWCSAARRGVTLPRGGWVSRSRKARSMTPPPMRSQPPKRTLWLISKENRSGRSGMAGVCDLEEILSVAWAHHGRQINRYSVLRGLQGHQTWLQ